jgi:hypothetical protein
MHDRVTEILGAEVVGEVRRVGHSFFDAGLGRVAVEPLSRERVDELVARLQRELGARLAVSDWLHMDDPAQLVRGLLVAKILPDGGDGGAAPYTLQLSSPALFALYERRFLLAPGQLADLGGLLCYGLARVVRDGAEGPLRLLSGLDSLLRRYLEILDATLRDAAVGKSGPDVGAAVAELALPLRAAWRLTPWPLRESIATLMRAPDRIVPHDRVLKRTILFASNVIDGKLVYQYVHQHNPLEEYDQVLAWMTEIHQAIAESYPPPTYAAAIARASSVETFLQCFPGYRAIVGPPPAGDEG